MITNGSIMVMHGKDSRLRMAAVVDARFLRIECPKHKGVLIPVTGIKFGTADRNNETHSREAAVWMEALCIYCNKYQYFRVREGSQAGLDAFKWNE